MTYSIFSGMSQQFYHVIPNSLDLITTAPTRDGIFKYLSQIGYDKFPEFILDILLIIEKHTPVDLTDGPGDEKQDILTINEKGERCLTQCKHTINFNDHNTGDDLDLLVSACLRKNCKAAFFVTNSDLTPPAKKYITDKEYARGFSNPLDCPDIDYLNGFKIWEKIKNNQDIINKWFSGLGQVHDLRNFKFDVTIQKLPYKGSSANDSDAFNNILGILSKKAWIKEKVKGMHYEATISNEFAINIKRWFQFTGELDINFILPEDDLSFFDKPLYALSFEVIMNSSVSKYSPKKIQEKILKKIAESLLNIENEKYWYHLTTSKIKSIIYLHDISEPREIILTSASTFVKIKSSPIQNEFEYCSLNGKKFKIIDEESDDTIWEHKPTNIQIVQMFEQKFNPVENYNYQIQQFHQLSKLSKYDFYAVEKIDSSLMMRIRRLLNPSWMAFQFNDNTLIWAVDPTADKDLVKYHHDKILTIGLTILRVRKKDSDKMLKECQKDPLTSRWITTADFKSISFPILLNKRTFWLSKDVDLKDPYNLDTCLKLLKFKFVYEKKYGFDNLLGKTTQNISSVEIKGMLFDFFTVRGKRMMDIGLKKNSISINIRYSENKIESSTDLALEYIAEFRKTLENIQKLIK
jgi:hypothetical protein